MAGAHSSLQASLSGRSRRVVRLLAVALFLAASACVTTPAVQLPASWEDHEARMKSACERGRASACAAWGDILARDGALAEAEAAYAVACAMRRMDSCRALGQMLMDRGEFDAAEPLLRAVLEEEETEESYVLLAELYEARGQPEDLRRAERLRWDGLAIDKPLVEVYSGYRLDFVEGVGTELVLNVQPMVLLSRRLSLGFHGVARRGQDELNGFLGYQHHASTWVVPYARVLVGSDPEPLGRRLNLGVDAGVKLAAGPLGHLNFSVGSSRASPFHVSVGLGVNIVLLLLGL